jgi:hypothetical protein
MGTVACTLVAKPGTAGRMDASITPQQLSVAMANRVGLQ